MKFFLSLALLCSTDALRPNIRFLNEYGGDADCCKTVCEGSSSGIIGMMGRRFLSAYTDDGSDSENDGGDNSCHTDCSACSTDCCECGMDDGSMGSMMMMSAGMMSSSKSSVGYDMVCTCASSCDIPVPEPTSKPYPQPSPKPYPQPHPQGDGEGYGMGMMGTGSEEGYGNGDGYGEGYEMGMMGSGMMMMMSGGKGEGSCCDQWDYVCDEMPYGMGGMMSSYGSYSCGYVCKRECEEHIEPPKPMPPAPPSSQCYPTHTFTTPDSCDCDCACCLVGYESPSYESYYGGDCDEGEDEEEGGMMGMMSGMMGGKGKGKGSRLLMGMMGKDDKGMMGGMMKECMEAPEPEPEYECSCSCACAKPPMYLPEYPPPAGMMGSMMMGTMMGGSMMSESMMSESMSGLISHGGKGGSESYSSGSY